MRGRGARRRGRNVRYAALEFMQMCALQQAVIPKDVTAIKQAVTAPPPKPPTRPASVAATAAAPAATGAASAGSDTARQLQDQLDVLRVQRKQIEGYIKSFQKEGQKDEVEMLQRSKLDLDVEMARVDRLLKAAKAGS